MPSVKFMMTREWMIQLNYIPLPMWTATSTWACLTPHHLLQRIIRENLESKQIIVNTVSRILAETFRTNVLPASNNREVNKTKILG